MNKAFIIWLIAIHALVGCGNKPESVEKIIELYATYYALENIPKLDTNRNISVNHHVERHEELRELLYKEGHYNKLRVPLSDMPGDFDNRQFFLDMLQIAPMHHLYPSIESEIGGTFIQVLYVADLENEIRSYFELVRNAPDE